MTDGTRTRYYQGHILALILFSFGQLVLVVAAHSATTSRGYLGPARFTLCPTRRCLTLCVLDVTLRRAFNFLVEVVHVTIRMATHMCGCLTEEVHDVVFGLLPLGIGATMMSAPVEASACDDVRVQQSSAEHNHHLLYNIVDEGCFCHGVILVETDEINGEAGRCHRFLKASSSVVMLT